MARRDARVVKGVRKVPRREALLYQLLYHSKVQNLGSTHSQNSFAL